VALRARHLKLVLKTFMTKKIVWRFFAHKRRKMLL
jgi:hypothetical protein